MVIEAGEATLQMVALVLQAGANINLVSHMGNTPLHVACAAGASIQMLGLLTAARADVGATNVRGETCLHLVAVSKLEECNQARA